MYRILSSPKPDLLEQGEMCSPDSIPTHGAGSGRMAKGPTGYVGAGIRDSFVGLLCGSKYEQGLTPHQSLV